MKTTSAELIERIKKIELLVLDVDGVLTDGTLYYSDSGIETKRFHVRDGSGLKLWQLAGKRAAVISGRSSQAVANRAMELGLWPVKQGCGSDKRKAFAEVLAETNLSADRVACVGDDWPDMPLFDQCGVSIVPFDGCRDAKAVADYVSAASGGLGAVRDAIEWMMGLTGDWEKVTAMYRGN